MQILNIITPFINTSFKKYIKSGLWVIWAQVTITFCSLLLTVYLTNTLAIEDYGTYKYILLVTGITSIAMLPGTKIALIQAVSRGYERTFFPLLRIRMYGGVLSVIITICIAAYHYYIKIEPEIGTLLFYVAFLIILYEPLSLTQSYFLGKKLFTLSSQQTIIQQIVTTITVWYIAYKTHSVVAIIITFFGTRIILNISFLLHLLLCHPPRGATDYKAISYSLQLSAIKGISIILGHANSILLAAGLGPTGLAIFSVSIAPAEYIRGVMRSMENILLPHMSQNKWNNNNTIWFFRKLIPYISVTAIGIIIYNALAPILFKIIFPKYVDYVYLSQWYAGTLLLTVIITVLSTILKAKKMTLTQHMINAIDLSLLVLITAPLIYFYHIIGLIVAIYIQKFIHIIFMTHQIFIRQHRC